MLMFNTCGLSLGAFPKEPGLRLIFVGFALWPCNVRSFFPHFFHLYGVVARLYYSTDTKLVLAMIWSWSFGTYKVLSVLYHEVVVPYLKLSPAPKKVVTLNRAQLVVARGNKVLAHQNSTRAREPCEPIPYCSLVLSMTFGSFICCAMNFVFRTGTCFVTWYVLGGVQFITVQRRWVLPAKYDNVRKRMRGRHALYLPLCDMTIRCFPTTGSGGILRVTAATLFFWECSVFKPQTLGCIMTDERHLQLNYSTVQ